MATPAKKQPMVKMNLYFPKPYKDWLESESIKTGLSQSALVHLALKTYIDQQRSMEMMPKLMNVLAELKGEEIDPKDMEKLLDNISKTLE